MNSFVPSRVRAVQFQGGAGAQRGIILIVTLMCLVIMLVSAIALIRATDASQILAGNLGFKRDLVNQGERGFQPVYAALNDTTKLGSTTTRASNQPAYNYSACILPTDSKGIPLILEDDSNFASATDTSTPATCHTPVAVTSNDIVDATNGITVRYVIDRLCIGTATPTSQNCISDTVGFDLGGTGGELKAGATPTTIYRISVRVTGPHNTLTYMQSTVTL